jgi:hypothetical protein
MPSIDSKKIICRINDYRRYLCYIHPFVGQLYMTLSLSEVIWISLLLLVPAAMCASGVIFWNKSRVFTVHPCPYPYENRLELESYPLQGTYPSIPEIPGLSNNSVIALVSDSPNGASSLSIPKIPALGRSSIIALVSGWETPNQTRESS